MKKNRLIFFIAGMVLVMNVSAQVDKIKAIMIYKLASQVTWKASTAPFVIGIYGSSNVKDVLDIIAQSKTMHNRTMKVITITSNEQIDNCQLLYVTSDNNSKISILDQYIESKNILLMTETIGSIKKGAEINLAEVDGKILFEISKTNLSNQKLVASDELFALAYKVY